MQCKYGLGRCKGFCDALSEMGVDLPNAEFGDFSDPTHVGKVLGGDIYGNHYILSQEGAGPISVLTGRQLSIGYGTAAIPGTYFNPYTQTNQYWGDMEFIELFPGENTIGGSNEIYYYNLFMDINFIWYRLISKS